MYDNKNHHLRSHIITLMIYLKSNEKIEQRITYDKDKLKTHFRKCNAIEQSAVIRSFCHCPKQIICSLYRLAAGEKILHMESFAWLYN